MLALNIAAFRTVIVISWRLQLDLNHIPLGYSAVKKMRGNVIELVKEKYQKFLVEAPHFQNELDLDLYNCEYDF